MPQSVAALRCESRVPAHVGRRQWVRDRFSLRAHSAVGALTGTASLSPTLGLTPFAAKRAAPEFEPEVHPLGGRRWGSGSGRWCAPSPELALVSGPAHGAGVMLSFVARIGTSGWSYAHWEDVLYPPGTPPARRLGFYVREFDTVELNASHYRWPRNTTFAGWRRRLPAHFTMSVKAPRGLTHAKKLYSPEVWVDRIAASWHELYDKRAIFLLQLPPSLERDDERLEWFLDRLPWWVQVAVEMRHPSWHDEAVFDLLTRHRAAYCVMSGAGLPCVLRSTAPTVYVRLHGPSSDWLYGGSYSEDDLAWWADRVREWENAGREVYTYFNNDGDGNAVRNARRLRELLNN